MKFHIALIPGDGIGPEIVKEAKKVLDRIAEKYHHEFTYETLLMGGCSIDAYGTSLTDETLEKAKAADSVLLEMLEIPNGMILIQKTVRKQGY